jgi:hypothetical protein
MITVNIEVETLLLWIDQLKWEKRKNNTVSIEHNRAVVTHYFFSSDNSCVCSARVEYVTITIVYVLR